MDLSLDPFFPSPNIELNWKILFNVEYCYLKFTSWQNSTSVIFHSRFYSLEKWFIIVKLTLISYTVLILVTITEILPRDKKAKEEKVNILGQCCVDLLPLLRGMFLSHITHIPFSDIFRKILPNAEILKLRSLKCPCNFC